MSIVLINDAQEITKPILQIWAQSQNTQLWCPHTDVHTRMKGKPGRRYLQNICSVIDLYSKKVSQLNNKTKYPPPKKMAILNWNFISEDTKTATKNMTICSTPLVPMKIQIKMTMKYHYTSTSRVTIKSGNKTKCLTGCGAIGIFFIVMVKCKTSQSV